MADKDSYEYPEETKSTQETFGMGSKMGRTENLGSQLAMLKDPRILGSLVGFMIFSYLVSHLLSFLIGSSHTAEVKKEPVKPAQQVKSQQEVNSLAAQLKAQQQQAASTRDDIKNTVNSVQNQSQENIQEIKKVASKVNHLEDTLAELSNNISDLHYEISLVTDQIKALKQAKPKAVPKKMIKKRVKRVIKKRIPNKYFSIKAAIHGRAWLSSKTEGFVTVKLGDALPTYGKVIAIDPNLGVVRTSSGRNITFSSTDE